MCVAVYLPAGKEITNETLEACYKTNKDSIGFMFNSSEGLQIHKFLEYKPFKKSFRELRKLWPLSDFVVHFRIGTSGKIDYNNCHPFRIANDVGLVHNGVLRCVNGDAKESDTHKFTQILRNLMDGKPELWGNDQFWKFVEEIIGTYNKLILLRNDGDFKIINEKAGTWKDGVWFSNTNWEPRVYNTTPYRSQTNYTSTVFRKTVKQACKCIKCHRVITFYEDRTCQKCFEKYGAMVPAIPPTPALDKPKVVKAEWAVLVNPVDAAILYPGVTAHRVIDIHDSEEALEWVFEGERYHLIESKSQVLFKADEDFATQLKGRRWAIDDDEFRSQAYGEFVEIKKEGN